MPKTTKKDTLEASKAWYQILKGYEQEELKREDILKVFSDQATEIISKRIDPEAQIVFNADDEKQEIKIYNTNGTVVANDYELSDGEEFYCIKLSDAKKIKKTAKEDDTFDIEINFESFENSSDPKIKLILKILFLQILQNIKVIQRKNIYEKYSKLVGQTVNACFLSKNTDGSWNVKILNNENSEKNRFVEAYLPNSLVSSKRKINPGTYLNVVIDKVEEESKQLQNQIIVSLDSPKIVAEALKAEVPEIANELIEIVDICRQPGERTKVSIRKSEKGQNLDFDVYGAVIGTNGSRIMKVIEKLNDEKIDIIVYSDNKEEFILNSMSPARIVGVVKKDEGNNSYWIIVNKISLTPAIGKKGINATLASNLTKAKLDIITTEKADQLNIPYDKERAKKLLENKIDNKPKRNSFQTKNRRNNAINTFGNFNVNMENFESDIAAFEAQEQEDFERNNYEDLDFEELFKKHTEEQENAQNANKIDANAMPEGQVKKEKFSTEDYKNAKAIIKDFVVDSDLSSFGLDEEIDLSEFDEEFDK